VLSVSTCLCCNWFADCVACCLWVPMHIQKHPVAIFVVVEVHPSASSNLVLSSLRLLSILSRLAGIFHRASLSVGVPPTSSSVGVRCDDGCLLPSHGSVSSLCSGDLFLLCYWRDASIVTRLCMWVHPSFPSDASSTWSVWFPVGSAGTQSCPFGMVRRTREDVVDARGRDRRSFLGMKGTRIGDLLRTKPPVSPPLLVHHRTLPPSSPPATLLPRGRSSAHPSPPHLPRVLRWGEGVGAIPSWGRTLSLSLSLLSRIRIQPGDLLGFWGEGQGGGRSQTWGERTWGRYKHPMGTMRTNTKEATMDIGPEGTKAASKIRTGTQAVHPTRRTAHAERAPPNVD